MHDTSPEADAFLVEKLRGMSVGQRVGKALELSSFTARLSKRAIARAHPHWSEQQREAFFVELHYGKALAEDYRKFVEAKCNPPS